MTTRNREQTLAFRYLPFASAFCFDFRRFGVLLFFERSARVVTAFCLGKSSGSFRISRPLEITQETFWDYLEFELHQDQPIYGPLLS